MKSKKLRTMLDIILCLLFASLIVFLLVACPAREPEIDHGTVTGREYTPAHSEVYTTYVYKYDFWSGKYRMMPETKSRWVDDVYEITIQAEDGRTRKITTNKDQYDQFEVGTEWPSPKQATSDVGAQNDE